MNFLENYSFVVQDSIKGFYLENSQATLHPFVVYYKLNDILKNKCYCVISDFMHRDTISVHVCLNKLKLNLKFACHLNLFIISVVSCEIQKLQKYYEFMLPSN